MCDDSWEGVNPKTPPVDCVGRCRGAMMNGLDVVATICAVGVGVAGVAVIGIGRGRGFNRGLTSPSAYIISPFIQRMEVIVHFHLFQFFCLRLLGAVSDIAPPPPPPAEMTNRAEPDIVSSGVASCAIDLFGEIRSEPGS